jgi:hypothetical protein
VTRSFYTTSHRFFLSDPPPDPRLPDVDGGLPITGHLTLTATTIVPSPGSQSCVTAIWTWQYDRY